MRLVLIFLPYKRAFRWDSRYAEKWILIYVWEVRSTVSDGICRIFFTVDANTMILLHGFKKKSQKTPLDEIETAKNRLRDYKEQNK